MKNKKRSMVAIVSAILLLIATYLVPEGPLQDILTNVLSNVTGNVSTTTTSSVNTAIGSDFYITYLDVGQGDAALIQCDGHYMLIDGGEAEYSNQIYSVLERNKITYLDIVVATHAHSDHIGGLSGALKYAKAGLVFCPVKSYDSETFRDFASYAKKSGSGITIPKKKATYELGSAKVTILGLNADSEDVNNTSIVLRVDYADRTFLFTGDAEGTAEKVLLNECPELLQSDVLKVGHHGSSSSTTKKFLKQVQPELAIISCGTDNKYGHPTEQTLERLKEQNVTVYRTDLHGDITIWYDGNEWLIATQKNN